MLRLIHRLFMEGNMTQSDMVAWYAAVVATIVLIWDFIKWYKGGSKVRIRIASNKIIWGGD